MPTKTAPSLQDMIDTHAELFRQLPANGSIDWENPDEVIAYDRLNAKVKAAKWNIEAGEVAYCVPGQSCQVVAVHYEGEIEDPFCDSDSSDSERVA